MSAQGVGKKGVSPFRLRDYQSADFDRLCEIDQACFPPEIACAAKQLDASVKEPGAFTLVAETGEGSIVAFLITSKPAGKTGHIVTLDVLPEFRRQGVATKLMQAAEERLRGLQIEKVVLETPLGSRAAHDLYQKLGFARVGYIKHYYPDGSDAWLMEKKIGGAEAAPA